MPGEDRRYIRPRWGSPDSEYIRFLSEPADVEGMRMPVRCTKCDHVYDLGTVTVTARYQDCSCWRCPGCGCAVDDRPVGWGNHHYVNLDANGYPRTMR